MKKRSVALVVALSAIALFGAETVPPSKIVITNTMTKAEYKARLKESMGQMIQNAGGFCKKEGTGHIIIVNCQNILSDADLARFCKKFKYRNKIETKSIRNDQPNGIADYRVPEGAAGAVYIVDDKALPMSLVANETGWGVVNVAKIATVKSVELNTQRILKELMRVCVLTFGGGQLQYDGSIMMSVLKPEDLDQIDNKMSVPVELAAGMTKNLRLRGITEFKTTSYLVACREGWAPAPTNDVQKAIWDKVHAPPEKPLKITYDKASQKPVVK